MPCVRALLFAFLLPSFAPAERHKLTFVPGSPAGEQLELIQHQIETARKIEQMEWFLKTFPKHEANAYLLEWMQTFYARGNNHPKVIEAGERLLALYPDDFDAIWRCRVAAEKLNDKALLEKWNTRALQQAAIIVVNSRPAEIDETAWKQTIEMAKGLLENQEYERFNAALQLTAPREKIAALEAFAAKYPLSKYGPSTWSHLLPLYRAQADNSKALYAATKLLLIDPNNIDALLLSGQIMLEQRGNYPKIQAHGQRVIDLAAKLPADKQAYYLGAAQLMVGNTYVNTNNFAMADKHLRLALPYLKGSGNTEAAVLFFLGWANYNMEKYPEAADYFQQCTAFGGQFGEQASKNITAMQGERRIP
jgi:tetratricopeptide (TPR) repeat protein